ncbi:unnamed protein product [Symbiodinium pilosum]|uniref:Uncharacterized protein n=1 Tax=Symbiodinium pilosum TaxID=2952 RepID=A0A812WWY8_SYMPI|nr:unnamed protein product [Symbiodinium pilosum]
MTTLHEYHPVAEASLCSEDFLLGADTSPGRIQYVGSGRGAFAKVDDVKYVGEGRGDFDVVKEPSGRCLTLLCWFCCGGSLIAVFIAAVITSRNLQHLRDEPVTRYSCYTSDGSIPPPDAQMLQSWSVPHRIWCCDNVGVGCQPSTSLTTTPVPTTWIMVPVPDFHAGFMAPTAPGGPPATPFAMTFHCHVGVPSLWSKTQQDFCCERVKIGCQETATIPPEPDCVVSAANDPSAWPASKRLWCCQNHETGCVQDGSFTCNEGDESTWAEEQKAYCCTTAGLGCTTALPMDGEMYDCTEGYANWPEWPADKQSWCCTHHSRACAASDATQYDCSTLETSWDTVQKEWCCTHHGKGCTE